MARNPAFVRDLIIIIIMPQSLLSDPACMLLNNISKCPAVIDRILDPEINLDNLLHVFCQGDGEEAEMLRRYNPHANFNFLSGVFANVSSTPSGAALLLGSSTIDHGPSSRISRLALFISHKSLIKRGGVVSALKNVFLSCPGKLLDILVASASRTRDSNDDATATSNAAQAAADDVNLLALMLEPLLGPEEYTMEEMELLPDALQFAESDKTREPDAALRLMLCESLLIIASSEKRGRDLLRANGVYRLLQKVHLVEQAEEIRQGIESTVDLRERKDGASGEEIPKEIPVLRMFAKRAGVYRLLQKLHLVEQTEEIRECIESTVDLLERKDGATVEEISDEIPVLR
ncbi:MAG: hypothetical protein SGCHY_004996 [Lobulomycetales sp.]